MFLNPAEETERVERLKLQHATYVIVTHTPSIKNPLEPSHVSIVLVDKNCRYVQHIDLAKHIAIRVGEAAGMEVVVDRREIKLKTVPATGKGA